MRGQVLELPVDLVNQQQAVEIVAKAIEQHQPLHVVTLNAEMAMNTLEDPELREIIQQSGLVLPDGSGVVWALARKGQKIAKLAGVDFVMGLLEMAAERGWRVYYLGATDEVIREAVERCQGKWPDLKVAGYHHGFFQGEGEVTVVAGIQAASPDILLVALGVPRQEKWIARFQRELGVPVAIGVGGTFDVMAGRVNRAPRWMQRLHMEWLYRLVKEPWRWRRMMALPRFVRTVWERER